MVEIELEADDGPFKFSSISRWPYQVPSKIICRNRFREVGCAEFITMNLGFGVGQRPVLDSELRLQLFIRFFVVRRVFGLGPRSVNRILNLLLEKQESLSLEWKIKREYAPRTLCVQP